MSEDPIALHGYTNSNAGYADVRAGGGAVFERTVRHIL